MQQLTKQLRKIRMKSRSTLILMYKEERKLYSKQNQTTQIGDIHYELFKYSDLCWSK